MKIGIHLSTFTASWGEDILPYIETSAKIGYEAVEIPLMSPDTFDFKEAKRLLDKHNLSCTCGTGLNPMEDISSLDNNIRNAGIKRLKKCIDICEHLGSDCLGGVLYAPWGQRVPREESEQNIKNAIYGIGEIADYAKEKGVTLSLEILNRYESYFMNTIEEGLNFISKVDKENVKLHFDTFHAHIEEKNIVDAIKLGGENIYHVHLCDNNRAAPGSGSINFEGILNGLKEIDFKRFMMVENFVIPNSESGNEVCIWRKSFDTPYDTAKAAFDYIDKLLKGTKM